MTYKDQLTAAMTMLAQDDKVRFIGYGVKYGGRAAGTLAGVPLERCIETPVAENLMVGIGIGLSLKGYKPVVYIERFDFILNALDAIVNHLDKFSTISQGQFKPTMILRVVVGNRQKPLYTGATHIQDFTKAMRELVFFPVQRLRPDFIVDDYRTALSELEQHSTMLIEYKDCL